MRIARILGSRVAELEDRLTDLALRPLPARVASALLDFASPSPTVLGRRSTVLHVRLTHEQLASVTREATSRALSEMADQGLVRQSRGRASIPDPALLRRVVHNPE